MKKFIVASALLFLLVIVAVLSGSTYSQPAETTFFFDDFDGSSLSSGWKIDYPERAHYNVNSGFLVLIMGRDAPIHVFRDFSPESPNFSISTRVIVTTAKNNTFGLSVHTAQLRHIIDFYTGERRFEASGTTIYRPSATEICFVLEMKASRDEILYNIYNDSGTLLASFTAVAGDVGFSYDEIRYFGLIGQGNERVDWLKITIPTPPVFTLSLSSSTSYVGFKVEINGNLTCDDKAISGMAVLLSYSVTNGATWNEISSVNTASDGSFSVEWMPSATGNYLVRASWAGNSNYQGANTTVSLAVTPFQEQNVVFAVTSNSTVSQLFFNSTSRELSFAVTGPSGTTGYVDVHIDKSLIDDISTLKVYLNGNQLSYTASSTDNSWLVCFTYQHSTHKVVVDLGPTSTTPTQPFIGTPLGIATIGGVVAALIAGIFIALRRRRAKARS